ncbi:MAG: prepilin peptidase [Moritella sp.]|uniref:prepilin peptidase n=1 Tax=Moritella sp. TaxID=78556 RepID=UPI000C1191AC|nr:A24 family peptidase [Moritella sp.]MBL1417334.1 prepilin peptidase [Moritella sp.]
MQDLALLFQLTPWLLWLSVAFLGLLVGSFLNVVIYRLPIMMEREWKQECTVYFSDECKTTEPKPGSETTKFNLLLPRSACPKCDHQITALENIPVISWLVLRGKCSNCANPISARYPSIELLTGLLSLVVAMYIPYGIQLAGALILTWTLVALTFIDIDKMLLPDQITLPLLWLGLFLNVNYAWVTPSDAIIGAIVGYLSLWSVYWGFKLLTGKEGMGYGDFKLLAAFGAWFGWQSILAIVLLSSFAGAIIGITQIALKKHTKGNPIPFGPYLAIAGWLYLIWGDQLVDFYLVNFVY